MAAPGITNPGVSYGLAFLDWLASLRSGSRALLARRVPYRPAARAASRAKRLAFSAFVSLSHVWK